MYLPLAQSLHLAIEPLGKVHILVHVEQLLLPAALHLPVAHAGQFLVSSLSPDVPYFPTPHDEWSLHELAIKNGFTSGDDMYLPAGQHPYRALLVPRYLNALLLPVIPFVGSHLLPHNVRLNPLFSNTANHKRRKFEIFSKNKKIKNVVYGYVIETNKCKEKWK